MQTKELQKSSLAYALVKNIKQSKLIQQKKLNQYSTQQTFKNFALTKAQNKQLTKLEGGRHMNENAIHGAPKKGLRMENCTKQSLRMAPNSKVEET